MTPEFPTSARVHPHVSPLVTPTRTHRHTHPILHSLHPHVSIYTHVPTPTLTCPHSSYPHVLSRHVSSLSIPVHTHPHVSPLTTPTRTHPTHIASTSVRTHPHMSSLPTSVRAHPHTLPTPYTHTFPSTRVTHSPHVHVPIHTRFPLPIPTCTIYVRLPIPHVSPSTPRLPDRHRDTRVG